MNYPHRIPKNLMQKEETRELATLIASDIVTSVRSENGFDDVVGHDAAKAALEEAVLMPVLHPDLFRQSGLGTQASLSFYLRDINNLYTLIVSYTVHNIFSIGYTCPRTTCPISDQTLNTCTQNTDLPHSRLPYKRLDI